MKNIHLALLILPLCFAIVSCGDEQKTGQTSSPAEQSSSVSEDIKSPEDQAKEKIIDVLSNYYTDLASENIQEDKYFAPQLDEFFASKAISREKVAQSLRSSFDQVEDRHITFDPKTLRVEKTPQGYVGEFSGKSIHKRSSDGQTINSNFSNRVSFNQNFQITGYTGLDANKGQKTRGLAPAKETRTSAVESTSSMAKIVLQEFQTGNFKRCGGYIHPKYGFYLIGQPGAYSVPYHLTSFQEVFKKAPWLEQGTDMHVDLKNEALPSFTCEGDNSFSKQGCFIQQRSQYKRLSELMRALRQAEFEEFGPKVVAKASNIEKLIKIEVVETKSGIAYYYGEDAGKWYLMIIDMASYSCSA